MCLADNVGCAHNSSCSVGQVVSFSPRSDDVIFKMPHFLLDESNLSKQEMLFFSKRECTVQSLRTVLGVRYALAAQCGVAASHEGACWSEESVLFVLGLLLYSYKSLPLGTGGLCSRNHGIMLSWILALCSPNPHIIMLWHTGIHIHFFVLMELGTGGLCSKTL